MTASEIIEDILDEYRYELATQDVIDEMTDYTTRRLQESCPGDYSIAIKNNDHQRGFMISIEFKSESDLNWWTLKYD